MSYSLKAGDTKPPIEAQLLDGDGVGRDLTAGPSTVDMRLQFPDLSVVTYTGITLGAGSKLASDGWCSYQWIGGDTDIPGNYKAEFIENFSGGGSATYPSSTVVYFPINAILTADVDPTTITWGDVVGMVADAADLSSPFQSFIINHVNNCLDESGFTVHQLRLARLYLAAHHATVGLLNGSFPRGPVTSLSGGGISKSFASVVAASAHSLGQTPYGMAYKGIVNESAHRVPIII